MTEGALAFGTLTFEPFVVYIIDETVEVKAEWIVRSS